METDHAPDFSVFRNVERKTGFHPGSWSGHAFPDIAQRRQRMGLPIAIVAEVALKIASRSLGKASQPAPQTIEAVAKEIAADPVLKNELNAEPPYQSRVAVGSVVAALGVVVPPLAGLLGWSVDGSAIVEFISSVVTLSGAAYALYGRFRVGLKPLFARG
jgi:hypothetical protein